MPATKYAERGRSAPARPRCRRRRSFQALSLTAPDGADVTVLHDPFRSGIISLAHVLYGADAHVRVRRTLAARPAKVTRVGDLHRNGILIGATKIPVGLVFP